MSSSHRAAFDEIRAVCLSVLDNRTKSMQIAEIIRRTGNYRWTGLYEVQGEEIAAIAWTGIEAPSFPRFAKTLGLCGAAVREGVTVVVGDVTRDNRYLAEFGETRSEMIVPVFTSTGPSVVGLIDVESERLDAFSDSDRTFVEGCATLVVSLWEHAGGANPLK